MKIRSGFVSNSSTSSFVIVGFGVPYKFQDKAISKAKEISGPEFIDSLACEKCGYKPFTNYRNPPPKICDQCGGKLSIALVENEKAYTVFWAMEKLGLEYYRHEREGYVAGLNVCGKSPEQAIVAQKEVTKILKEKFPEEKFEIKLFGGEYPR